MKENIKPATGRLGVLVVGVGGLPFTDVTSGDWFYDAVAYVYDRSFLVVNIPALIFEIFYSLDAIFRLSFGSL